MAKEEGEKSIFEKKHIRTTDDFMLIQMILDENPPLKYKVLNCIEKNKTMRLGEKGSHGRKKE